MKQEEFIRQQAAVSGQQTAVSNQSRVTGHRSLVTGHTPSPSALSLLNSLLTVNNVGLAERCRRYRRRRTAARTTQRCTLALCLLAIVPVTAVKTLPTHHDYICAISHSGHATANAAAVSINTMFCTK